MSDTSGGSGWWQATDGKWYPPERHAAYPPPRPDWWLASDLKWYPPERGSTDSPPPTSVTAPEGPVATDRSSARLRLNARGKVVLASAVIILVGIAAGTAVAITAGGHGLPAPSPAIAGNRGTSFQGGTPTATTTSPVTTPPVTAPTTTPPVTTTPTTSQHASAPRVATSETPTTTAASTKTTTVPCPTGSVRTTTSSQELGSGGDNTWSITLVASVTNNTTARIALEYVSVFVLGANGDLLDQGYIRPAGVPTLLPGSSTVLTGSDSVSSLVPPGLGQVTTHWTWADEQDAACPL